MHLHERNVNTAFRTLVQLFYKMSNRNEIELRKYESRYGEVLAIDEPITITFSKPRERVLINDARDANPFLSLYEGLWMLAGRNDLAPLVYYNKRMAEFSDNGKTVASAYGYRWRHASTLTKELMSDPCALGTKLADGQVPRVDQIAFLISHLKDHPNTRRAVLQMWNVEDDLLNIDTGKDICCNLSVLFSIRPDDRECSYCIGNDEPSGEVRMAFGCEYCRDSRKARSYLDMTVFNRSNDLTWGLLGSDYVHFSLLQEYIASQINAIVGKYHHISNNLHVYTSRWHPQQLLADDWACRVQPSNEIQLIRNPGTFNLECWHFVELNKNGGNSGGHLVKWDEPFLQYTAQPMLNAFHAHKVRDYDAARTWCMRIAAADWRLATTLWIERRHDSFLSNKTKETDNG